MSEWFRPWTSLSRSAAWWRRERSEALQEEPGELGSLPVVPGSGLGEHVGLVGRQRPPACRPQMVPARVHRHPVQPCPEVQLALHMRDAPIRLEEDVLRHVARVLAVADETQRQAEHGVLVVRHELGEGAWPIRPQRLHQPRVVTPVQAVGGAGRCKPELIAGQARIVSFYCHRLLKKPAGASRP
jgi:hypothetical protein